MPQFSTMNGDGREFSREGYNTAAAAGARRGDSFSTLIGRMKSKLDAKNAPQPAPFLGGYPDKFIGYANQATTGAANLALGDFRKQVGGLLGGLNAIGGLRSGAVQAGVNDISDIFSRNISNVASANSLEALRMGQTEYDYDVERRNRDRARRDARRASNLGTIGKVAGTVLDFVPGGKIVKGVGKILGKIF